MGDDEAYVEVDDADTRLPVNQDPPVIWQYYSNGREFMAQYGWIVFVAAVVLYVIWRRLEPMIRSWSDSAQLAAHKKYDASQIEQRQLAMEAHRQRLQEEYDRKAAAHAVKVAEREEKKRQEKLEDWERHQAGQGYRSKVKKTDGDPPPTTTLPKSRGRLRDTDYSPLMGNDRGESSGFRPSRRGPAAGGG